MGGSIRNRQIVALLQAAPLAFILAAFLIVPIAMIAVVSLALRLRLSPAFEFGNYGKIFTTPTQLNLYINTRSDCSCCTYIATLLLGYTIAYHLADIR